MSKRNITFLNFTNKFLLKSVPKQPSKIDKIKIKIVKNRKIFSAPNFTNYSNYVLKRSFADEAEKTAYNRHMYDSEIEKLINEQIDLEFIAAYTYFGISMYYGRSDVALPGMYGLFMKMYYEELGHGLHFAKFQNMRGGRVKMNDIAIPKDTEYCEISDTFDIALTLEKTVKEKLQEVYRVASKLNDTNVTDMIDPFIADQEQTIYDLSRLFTRACSLSHDYIGKYLFDRELHETNVQGDQGKCVQDLGSKLYS